ncbi:MAG: hypothetical protein V4492_07015, partial [Chlamydiota bacterium]
MARLSSIPLKVSAVPLCGMKITPSKKILSTKAVASVFFSGEIHTRRFSHDYPTLHITFIRTTPIDYVLDTDY